MSIHLLLLIKASDAHLETIYFLLLIKASDAHLKTIYLEVQMKWYNLKMQLWKEFEAKCNASKLAQTMWSS